jgi:hypothetical protein
LFIQLCLESCFDLGDLFSGELFFDPTHYGCFGEVSKGDKGIATLKTKRAVGTRAIGVISSVNGVVSGVDVTIRGFTLKVGNVPSKVVDIIRS